MKLKLSLLPALLLAALMLLPSAFSELKPEFSLELVRLRGPAPVGSADSVPVVPWARGGGATTAGMCRDSVVGGSWEYKIWIVGDAGDSPTYPTFGDVITDSIDNYTDRWHWIYVIGGIKQLQGTSTPAATNDDCVTITSWAHTSGGDGDGAILWWDSTQLDLASIGGSGQNLSINFGLHWTVVGLTMTAGISTSGLDCMQANRTNWTFFSNVHVWGCGDENFSRIVSNAPSDSNRYHGLAYSIIGPSTYTKSLGGITGSGGKGDGYTSNISDYMNYFAENRQRAWRFGNNDSTQFWSSIVANWKNKPGELTWFDTLKAATNPRLPKIEFVSNRLRRGPWGQNPYFLETGFDADSVQPLLYLLGNMDDTVDAGNYGVPGKGEGGSGDQPGDSSMFRYNSFTDTAPPDSVFTTSRIITYSAFPMVNADTAAVRDTLMTQKKIGLWSVQNCAGVWVNKRSDPSREMIDTLISHFVNASWSGSDADHDEPTDWIPGGKPVVDQGTVCADSDGDGLADSVELARTSQVSSTSVSNKTVTMSGWTELELATWVGTENSPWTYTNAEIIANCSPGEACAELPASGHVSTYNDTINLYTDTMTENTFGSITYKGPSTDSIPPDHSGRMCYDADDPDRGVLITLDTLTGGNLMTAAEADALLNSWTREGCDTLSVKTDSIP